MVRFSNNLSKLVFLHEDLNKGRTSDFIGIINHFLEFRVRLLVKHACNGWQILDRFYLLLLIVNDANEVYRFADEKDFGCLLLADEFRYLLYSKIVFVMPEGVVRD